MEELYFNDISFKDMGLVIEEIEPIFTRASINTNEISIDGHESEYEELNYQNVSCDLDLSVLNPANMDAINAWLQGTGYLKYNNRVRKARVYDSFEYERIQAFYKATKVTFIMSPFWKAVDDYILVTDSVTNSGTVTARPIIKLVGTGAIDLTIGATRFTYNFDEDGAVEIDCDVQSEVWDGVSKSSQIELGYEYPSLVPGANVITIHSGACEIYIKNRSWYL